MPGNTNPIKYSDLISPDNSINELIKQLDELSDTYTNALKNIKAEATQLSQALTHVSGATETGREATKRASEQTDKLARAQKDLAFAESENAKTLQRLKQATKEQNDINKLVVKINNSAEGSYNRLSAQYSLNKIYLNNMSEAERKSTKDGQELEKETAAIYEEMKRLQEATGKHQLNVGNYGEATVKLSQQLKELTEQMVQLRLAGKENTAEYEALKNKAGQLRDVMDDTRAEIKNVASDTSNLDTILSGASVAGGGFAAATGAMQLFGAENEDLAKAQTKLQSVIAITNGLQAVQNALQKQSALMLGISTLQSTALAKSEAYRRLIQIQGTKATIGATVAQKAFNLVAAANPYVLLALALVTVVGALIAFANGTDKAAKNQERLNELERQNLDYLQQMNAENVRAYNERVAQLQRELELSKARNESLAEQRRLEDEIYQQKLKAHNQSVGFYSKEINDLEENRKKLQQLRDLLQEIYLAKSRGETTVKVDIDLDGKLDKVKVEDAINAVQASIDNLDRKVQIAVELETEGAELENQYAIMLANREKQNRDAAQKEKDILNETEDARIALIDETAKREEEQRKAATERAIAQIKFTLSNETNLTINARKSLNEQIVLLRQQLAKDLVKIANEQRTQEIAATRATEDIRIAMMQDGAEKQREQLRIGYMRQIEDLQNRLETETGLSLSQKEQLQKQIALLTTQNANEAAKLEDEIALQQLKKEQEAINLRLETIKQGSEEEIQLRLDLLEKQRQIELAENKKLAEDVRQSEADINAKYDALNLKQTSEMTKERELLLFDQQQELAQSEFDLMRNSEDRKTRFKLQAEKERLQKILELNSRFGNMLTDVEVKTMQNTIKRLDQEIERSKGDERGRDIYGLFGLNLDEDQKTAIDTSVSFAIEKLGEFLDAKVQAADAAVQSADKEVEAARKTLEAEIEARANGYANNVAMAQKDLDLAKKNQAAALKEQQKAQKAQAALQTIQQIGNLVTSTSLIWSQLGFPWAIPAIAVMWGSFAAAKIKANQVAKSVETYGEGTVELLSGGSHQSGNDIEFGTKPDGTQRRAEGGEFFAVINKRNSRKYRSVIPDVINSLNNGTFANKYMTAYDGAGDAFVMNVNAGGTDIRELNDNVRAIREQSQRRTYVSANGNIIEEYKNLKRVIK